MRRPALSLLFAIALLPGMAACSADDPASGAGTRAAGVTAAKGRPVEIPPEWREPATRTRQKSSRSTASRIPVDEAHGLRIMTLNAEHLMSPAVFARWQAFCEPLGWKDGPGDRRPPGLPYCDALNGRDLQGRLIFGPQHRRQDLDAKVNQLADLVRAARPDIVLMQEVTDAEAMRQVLGKGWTIHTTAERWRGGPVSQNLAVAWPTHRFLQEPRVEVVESLARSSPEGRRTRPGLAMYLPLPIPGSRTPGMTAGPTAAGATPIDTAAQDLPMRPMASTRRSDSAAMGATGNSPVPTLAILNVHLKAGCRHGRLDRSLSRQPTRQWRRLSSCQILQSQVPALEGWLDRQIAANHAVLISGDFNRDLREELKRGLPARGDDQPASRTVRTADEMQRIASVLPELDDDQPPGARLTLVASGPYRKLARCHRHIDPFLLSPSLGRWLRTPQQDLRVQVIPFDNPLSLERPRPSDHCPHVLNLPL